MVVISFTARAFAQEPPLPIPPPPPAAAPHATLAPLAVAPLPPAPLERRSPTAMVSGIVLTSAGGLAIMYVGATAMGGCTDDCKAHDRFVRGTVLGGALALAIGIPLLIYGAKRVPGDAAALQTLPLPKWAGAPSATGWGWTL
jgi:hypothetical protein